MKCGITHFFSCLVVQEYVALEGHSSNLVHTAWAMMAFIHAKQVILLFQTGIV